MKVITPPALKNAKNLVSMFPDDPEEAALLHELEQP